jgi:hypothetical protein
MCVTSCAMILMQNFVDIRMLFKKLFGGKHITGNIINWL